MSKTKEPIKFKWEQSHDNKHHLTYGWITYAFIRLIKDRWHVRIQAFGNKVDDDFKDLQEAKDYSIKTVSSFLDEAVLSLRKLRIDNTSKALSKKQMQGLKDIAGLAADSEDK